MAAFPPRDREAFMAHMAKVRRDPEATLKTIVVDGRVAGNAGSFVRFGKREVCYWLGREFWGRGVATEALQALLELVPERPLYARVAKRNPASRRVAEKCGFMVFSEDAYEEFLLRLD